MAFGADQRPERNARRLHTVRPDEGESSQLDANDHQVSSLGGDRKIEGSALGTVGDQRP